MRCNLITLLKGITLILLVTGINIIINKVTNNKHIERENMNTNVKDRPVWDRQAWDTPNKSSIDDTFLLGWQFLVKNEGGYSNDKFDQGGATMLGISLKFLKGLGIDPKNKLSDLDGDINNDGVINELDIKCINEHNAKDIYKYHFWQRAKCDEINSKLISIKFFDTCVNLGIKQATKILQNSINDLLIKLACQKRLSKDGVIGEITLTTLNKLTLNKKYESELLNFFIPNLKIFYKNIASKNISLTKFLKGWLIRAEKIPEE